MVCRLLLWGLLLAAACFPASSKNTKDGIKTLGGCQMEQVSYEGPHHGLFLGDSPSRLRPLELHGMTGKAAWPVANPVLLSGPAGGDISRPSLFATAHGALYAFFAQRNCSSGRSVIAAAVSNGGGASWRYLGTVLEEPFDLAAPFVFQDIFSGQVFLLPDASAAGEPGMHTYVATDFPLRWARNATLMPDARLVGASILFTGWPGSKKFPATWTLVGTTLEGGPGLAGEGSARLAVYRSRVGPGGPYEQHPSSPVALEGAVSAGRLFLKGKVMHRLGRTCPAAGSVSGGMRRLMQPRDDRPLTSVLDASAGCGPLAAFQLFISEEAIEQDTVDLSFGRRLWRQPAAWDSAGYSFLDVVEVGKDAWAALASAHRLPYAAPALAAQLSAAAKLLQAAGCLAAAVALVGAASQLPLLHGAVAARSAGRSLVRRLVAVGKTAEREAPQRSPVLQAFIHVDATARSVRAQPSVLQRRYQAQVDAAAGAGKASGDSGRGRRGCRRLLWRTLAAAVAATLTLSGAAGARFAMTLLQPFFASPLAVPVARQYSKFSLLVMSYEARLPALRRYVSHYSQCPSVGEIVVVWNKGQPPVPGVDLIADVPLRVRVEPTNSMNNRFKPDPNLHFRGVLMLDDDLMLPCSTIEAGFAEWRRDPGTLVGFFPRLLEPAAADGPDGSKREVQQQQQQQQGEGHGPPVFRGESHVIARGAYNAVLAGAAFMDSHTVFPLYWSVAATPARTMVDELMNCDDLLLNFVLANASAAATGAGDLPASAVGTKPPVRFLRPERRIDLGKLSGVGISLDMGHFKADADACLALFTQLFGGSGDLRIPLVRQRLEWRRGAGGAGGPPPRCLPLLGCMYL